MIGDTEAAPGWGTTPASGTVAGSARPRWMYYAIGGALYLALSVAVWWHLWAHPASVTTCGCGDSALTLWVLEWPAYALAHGINPFFSTALFYPHGINMAPNSLGLGVVFAPVTWLFGVVATSNVITTVSPALSALSMFWLLRRWVSWTPAAFAGGLFYGFSPFVLASLALAHPNFGLAAPTPLIVACIDELFVRQRRRAPALGLGLGLLLVTEFFVSVEVLLLTVLFLLIAAVVLVLGSALHGHAGTAGRAGFAARGLGTAAAVAAVLLAYPLWFFFAGPAHLVGRAWPDSPAGTVGSTVVGFANGHLAPSLVGIMHLLGGYQGPALPMLSFLGTGMLVVVVGGVLVWRHDRLLELFGLLALCAAALSLGVGHGYWAPWRLFAHLPVLTNVVPVNLTSITDLCVAIMLAVIVDRVRRTAGDRLGRTAEDRGHWVVANGTAAAVAALALVPVAIALWPNVPMTARPMVVPRWFATVARHLPPGKVVLPYPAALGGIQSSMAWQAVTGIPFSMVGGGGPGVVPARAGSELPGFTILARASLPLSPPPRPSDANLRAIRGALAGWGVTTIVVPDQPSLPTYDRGRTVDYAVGLFAAALGQRPAHRAGAWVWNDVRSPGSVVRISEGAFVGCTGSGTPRSPAQVARCVLSTR